MTKEILKQCEEGVIPSDKDLQTAIDHYKKLEEMLSIHSPKYNLVLQCVWRELDRLNGYQTARKFK